MSKKILLALSGGVDSSVSALLLQQKGWDVHCAVFIMSNQHMSVAKAAQEAAAQLSLPIEVLDLRNEFRENVIKPFCADYIRGRTPSPCVICNPLIKFRYLADLADSLGIEKIATGHYAKVFPLPFGTAVGVSECVKRDQSYMLYRLPQEILSRLILPLEGMSKEEVRKMAALYELSSAEAPDSEENCFISGETYIDFLERNGFKGPSGNLILPDGTAVPHTGIHRFTIGQRKGLGVTFSQPLYVKEIKPQGDVILCTAGGEYSSTAVIKNVVTNPNFKIREGFRFMTKIRSAAKMTKAEVVRIENDSMTLRFDPPARAACPGQSAVLYSDGIIVGGGIIDSIG